jgi:hypothetical protein
MGSYRRGSWEENKDEVERKDFFRQRSSISTLRSLWEARTKMESISVDHKDCQTPSASDITNHQSVSLLIITHRPTAAEGLACTAHCRSNVEFGLRLIM